MKLGCLPAFFWWVVCVNIFRFKQTVAIIDEHETSMSVIEKCKKRLGRINPWDCVIISAILIIIFTFMVLDAVFWSHVNMKGTFSISFC